MSGRSPSWAPAALTAYGRQVTEEIAGTLARSGVTIVSGLARGVDAIAHQAALNAGGRTLAVLGCGVDCIYPPENRRLAEQMLARGALISDYAPGTAARGPNFPPRNRIISGLSLAVVVVEAGADQRGVDHGHLCRRAGAGGLRRAGQHHSPRRARAPTA